MAYYKELRLRVELILDHPRLLRSARGRDYSADFSVEPVREPRLAPVRGKILPESVVHPSRSGGFRSSLSKFS